MKTFTNALCLTLLIPLSACVDNSSGQSNAVNTDNFDFVGMLANYADNLIIPNYESFANEARELSSTTGALASYCDAIGSANEANARSTAQDSWKKNMDTWQLTELHQLGPVLDNSGLLRNRIFSFTRGNPISTCGIDQSVVVASNNSGFNVSTRSTNQRGLGALEYLLFNEDLSHTCPSQVAETSDWNTRSERERRQLRCDYAELLAADIASAATSLHAAWQTEGGNYRSQFLNPTSTGKNLKALSDALFYLDTDTKDAKLGIPLGINASCSQITCPEVIESPYAEHSLSNIENNLQAFLSLLTGGSGLGFDDIIAQAGVAQVTTMLQSNANAALSEINAMNESLKQQVEGITDTSDEQACQSAADNPDGARTIPACNLYGYIRWVTDALKTGFVAAVAVDLPDRAQSDND